MIKISNKNDVTINKVSYTSKGLEIKCQSTSKEQGLTDHTIESKEELHPSFHEALQRLKMPLLYQAGLSGIVNGLFSKENLMLKEEVKKKAIETKKKEVFDELKNDLTITSVNFYHTGNGLKVKISGGFTTKLGYATMTTAQFGFEEVKFGFEEVKFGFEEDVEKALKLLTDETIEFLNGKRGQMDMFSTGEAGDEQGKEEPELEKQA